jgi:transcription elongation factor Elf1
MDNLDQLKPYRSTAAFYIAAKNICKKRGIKYNFICPLCGGQAHVKKLKKNASIHAKCENCKVDYKED